MSEWVAPVLTLAVIAIFIRGLFWYFTQIRKGRADHLVSPDWPEMVRPGSWELDVAGPRSETSEFYDPDDPSNRRAGGVGDIG